MKSRILSVVLCFAVLITTFALVSRFPNTTKNEETKSDGVENHDNATQTQESSSIVSDAYISETAHDAEDFFTELAYGKVTSYETKLADLILRLEQSSKQLKEKLQDYYGATYFSKIAELLRDIQATPFADCENFSSRTSKILTELENSYPTQETNTLDEKNAIYYPKFDTEVSGTTALGLLSIFRQQFQKSTGSILLTFAGNTVLGDTLLSVDSENSFKNKQEKSKYSYPLYKTASVFCSDTASFTNLEAPLTESIETSSTSGAYKGLPSYAKNLQNGGIDIVSISSPGILEYGSQGKADTKKNLTENKISCSQEGTICYYDSPLGSIAYLTYDIIDEINADVNQGFTEPPKQDIAAAKEAGAKFVIVHFNWITKEANDWDPCMAQVLTTRAAVDNGADLVFGSHPDAIQSIEQYNGVSVVYSAGTLFKQDAQPKESFIFQQAFKLDEEGNAKPGEILIVPISFEDGLPTLKLGSNDAQTMKKNLADVSRTLRYGVGKRADFTLEELKFVTLEK